MPGEGKVEKYHCSVDAQGELDELNAWLGCLLWKYPNRPENELIEKAQDILMHIGAQLAQQKQRIQKLDITDLEDAIDRMEEKLPPLNNFIIPSYPPEGHIARTVCRRAERQLSSWEAGSIDKEKFHLIIPYLNRFSDFLFVWCRSNCPEDKVWFGGCRHLEIETHPRRMPLLHGSAEIQVCIQCNMWRTNHHVPSSWREGDIHEAIAQAEKDGEEY